MRFRQLSDGSLAAPARGNPPAPPAGYTRSRGNPFIFLPQLPGCVHRTQVEKTSSCCGTRQLDYCTKDKKFLTYLLCINCNGVKPVIEPTGAELYNKLYTDPVLHYGSAQHGGCPGVSYLPQYINNLVSPIIDLGCGTGDTVKALREKGFTAQGMDWIDCGFGNIVQDITIECDLSEYHTAICLDVLEHVSDDDLPGLIANLKQTMRQVITVHCGASSKKAGYPQELHINIKTADAWRELLSKHFNIVGTIELAPDRYLYSMEHN